MQPHHPPATLRLRARRFLRSPRRLVDVVAWGSLAAFVVMTIGAPLLGYGVFLGSDLVAAYSPWREVVRPTGPLMNPSVGDTVDSVVPQTILIVDLLRQGHSSGWNPYLGGGVELGGLPNSGAFSPLSLPWWVVPYTYAPGLVKLLEMATATLGMSMLLRRLAMPSAAWAVGSLVFISSGFMIAWTNWPQTRVAAFIPLLFWALDRAAVRRRLIDGVAIGVVVAAMLLGGFPALVGYALYAGGAYVLVRGWQSRRSATDLLRAVGVSLLGLVLGLALSAWQIVPFIINSISVLDFSTRHQSGSDHLAWNELAGAVVPGLAERGAVGTLVERLSYFGVVTLVLIAAAILIRRRRSAPSRRTLPFFVIAAAVAIALVYLGGPLLEAAQELPIFSNNPVGRLRSMVGFFIAVAAAYGFTSILSAIPLRVEIHSIRRAGSRSRVWFVGRLLVVGALFVVTAVTVGSALADRPAGADVTPEGTGITVIALGGVLAAFCAVAVWIAPRASTVVIAGILLPVLVVIPAIDVARGWWPRSASSTFYPETPTEHFLSANLGDERFISVGQAMLPGTSTLSRLRSAGGHAFQTTEWKDLLNAVDPGAELSPTYTVLKPGRLSESITSPILDRMAVKYVVANPNEQPLGSAEGLPGGVPQTIRIPRGSQAMSSVSTGPVSGLTFVLGSPLTGSSGVSVRVELRDAATAEILASTETWQPSWSGQVNVALAADRLLETREWSAVVSFRGADVPVEVSTTSGQELAIAAIRPQPGIHVVHTGDATVYERESVLPRVRWANSATVIADRAQRIAQLTEGVAGGLHQVVLENADDDRPTDRTGDARISVADTPPAAQSISVQSDGAGWVIIADSFRRPGWTATIDNAPAQLTPADHAAAAVYVPSAGRHDLELVYRTPGSAVGTWVTLAGILLGGSVVIVTLLRRPQRRVHRLAGPATRGPSESHGLE